MKKKRAAVKPGAAGHKRLADAAHISERRRHRYEVNTAYRKRLG